MGKHSADGPSCSRHCMMVSCTPNLAWGLVICFPYLFLRLGQMTKQNPYLAAFRDLKQMHLFC